MTKSKLERPIDSFLKNVFFIFLLDENENEHYVGTGFILGTPIEYLPRYTARYFVTAKHVIQNTMLYQKNHGLESKIYIRFNLKTRGSKRYKVDTHHWKMSEEDPTIDAAVMNAGTLADNVDFTVLHKSKAVTKLMLKNREVAEGDEIFMNGLFVKHSGNKRNQPIVRTGNIAAVSKERIISKVYGTIEALLIEARSMGGLSGSPVFVYVGERHLGEKNDDFVIIEKEIKWLGIAQGHWDIIDEKSDPVNMGISLVVPAHNVMKIINSNHFKRQRAADRQRIIDKR